MVFSVTGCLEKSSVMPTASTQCRAPRAGSASNQALMLGVPISWAWVCSAFHAVVRVGEGMGSYLGAGVGLFA